MNTRSLRFRLIIWYAGLVTGVFVLLGVAMHQVLRHYLERNLAQLLTRRTDQIAVSLLPGVEQTGEKYVVDEIKARYSPENYDRFIRLTRADGTVLYASGRAASFDPSGLPPAADQTRERIAVLPNGNRLLVTAKAYQSASGRKYLIESGAPMQPIELALVQTVVMMVAGLPLVVLAVAGGGYLLVGRALAPVVRIAHSAERITLQNLNEQLPLTQTGDELEQLSLALNRMIFRLREAFDHNRRFLGDASHELRTPLTALRAELESVVEDARLPELRDRVGSALEEVNRLAKIVETLFAISRLESGEAQQERAQFDLARLVGGTADQMALLAEDKGVTVQCNHPSANVTGGRRPIAHQTSRRQPPGQRNQIHAGRGNSHVARPGPRQRSGVGGFRHRHWNSPRVLAARFRALLPRGRGALARRGRRGAGAGNRQVDLRRAWGPGGSRERRTPRHHVQSKIATGQIAAVNLPSPLDLSHDCHAKSISLSSGKGMRSQCVSL